MVDGQPVQFDRLNNNEKRMKHDYLDYDDNNYVKQKLIIKEEDHSL
jgi:hypothetical protein